MKSIRALSVWLPNWPITRLKRSHATYPVGAHGLALARQEGNVRLLAAVDDVAAAHGAFVGQAAADAQAILPSLVLREAEPEEDAATLKRLAEWCARFSPSVAVDAPDGLLIDTEGCAHLWGGEACMLDTIRARLDAEGVPAQAAIADTFGAAWALARFSGAAVTLSHGDAATRLRSLPVRALRIEPDVSDKLERLGLKQIGDVLKLPRAALTKRFGASLVRQIARALGEEPEALEFLHPPAPWQARRMFSEPISRAEDMAQILFDLTEDLCARLDQAGLGARQFHAAFHRVDGEAAHRVVSAALPMRDPKRLRALFAPKLEDLDPGFGVEVVCVRADAVEPTRTAQTSLIEASAEARNADLAPLIDRLRNRLGADNVWRAKPFASHVPERAVTKCAPLETSETHAWPSDRPRPIRLFARPQPIEAFAVAPDDPPFTFRWRGQTHKVRNAEGPERIGAEWWRKAWADNSVDRVRDYYRLEDESGARFWVFRAGMYGAERAVRWYLHGLFA